MVNRVILIGRLTRDPEMRYTPQGVAVTSFDLAVDRPFVNREGERGTDFIRIVTWRKLAEICANNLSKGRLVAVDGRLRTRSYEGRDGVRRRAAEVVADSVQFLDRPRSGGALEGLAPDLEGLEPPEDLVVEDDDLLV
ncbi:MAG: single-stranded DNA-binding protein [Moorellales bacterium]